MSASHCLDVILRTQDVTRPVGSPVDCSGLSTFCSMRPCDEFECSRGARGHKDNLCYSGFSTFWFHVHATDDHGHPVEQLAF